MEIIVPGDPFDVWNLKKNSSIFFGENWVQIFGGWGTLSSSPPSGAFVPHPTLADFGPRDPDKNGFCSGRSPPIWGRYGVWSVCTLAHFLSNCGIAISEILSWSTVPVAYYRFWDFKQNRYFTIRANFAQSWKKPKSHFSRCTRRKYS